MNQIRKQKGFSILELLITIGIFAVLSAISLNVFYSAYARSNLNSATRLMESSLERTRSLSLSVKDGIQHGVRVEPTQIIIFHGSAYVAGSVSNEIIELPTNTNATTTLTASDIIFQKLSGDADTTGTITLFLINSTTTKKTITIQSTGIITTT